MTELDKGIERTKQKKPSKLRERIIFVRRIDPNDGHDYIERRTVSGKGLFEIASQEDVYAIDIMIGSQGKLVHDKSVFVGEAEKLPVDEAVKKGFHIASAYKGKFEEVVIVFGLPKGETRIRGFGPNDSVAFRRQK